MRATLLAAAITTASFAVTVATPRVAFAQPDKAGAKAAFAAGLDADKRKDYAAAIEHYQRAYDLAPHPNALFNIAVDYEKLGDYRNAAAQYTRYLEEAGDSADDRPRVERLIESMRTRPSKVAIRTTPPGGVITIDGVRIGQAPVVRELRGGEHVLEAQLGDRRTQRPLTVEYGDPADITLAINEQLGTLSVSSNVSGASIEIDGAPMGVAPVTLSVAAGDRKVVVRSDGYASLERSVTVPAEGSAQINAILVRPVGYVEPTPPTRSYVFQIEGGRLVKVDETVFHLGFGYRFNGWEAALRLGFFGEGVYGYGLQVRRYLGEGRFKLYAGGSAEYATNASSGSASGTLYAVGGHLGFAVELAQSGKFVTELTLDAGAALYSAGDNRELAIPVMASVAFRGSNR